MARVILAFVLLLGSSVAHAEKRVALVIGNSAYQKVSKLLNPVNDARAIAGMLQAANFDEVTLHENLGIRELRQAIKDFSDLARDADTAVAYYSGHGIEVNGVNYLIPTDAVLDRDIDVPYETYSLENLVQVMEPARRLRLVMLDACRENPFTRSMKRTIGSRAVGRGLAPVEPTSVNTLIGFAAKAGSIALDGEGANSPYAIALLSNLPTPGLDLRIGFGRVRDEVMKATRNRQEPFVYGSLGGGTVSIVDGAAGITDSTPTSPSSPMPSAPVNSIDRAAQAWSVIQNTTSLAVLEDYIKHFGPTVYGSMAQARLNELNRSQVAVGAPPARPGLSTLPPESKKQVAVATSAGVPAAASCPSIVGTWNSWASGLWGKGDATFYKNDTATHRSIIFNGKGYCKNGQLHIEWADGKPGPVTLSADGKKIFSADGGVHMSRD
jgi:hypothetical protein